MQSRKAVAGKDASRGAEGIDTSGKSGRQIYRRAESMPACPPIAGYLRRQRVKSGAKLG
jgi:hypothetical protein